MGKKSSPSHCTVYVCDGGACARKKSKKVYAPLKALVKERGLKEHITVKKCPCFKTCGKGPVVSIEPGGLRFTQVKPKHVEKILERLDRGAPDKKSKRQDPQSTQRNPE